MKSLHRFGRWLTTPRVFRKIILSSITLVTLILLFYTFENWRGAKGWAAVMAEQRDKGAHTDWTQIIPAIPDNSENFCTIPLFKKMLTPQPGNLSMARDEKDSKEPFPKIIYLASNRPMPLLEIADYYRKTPSFPVPASGSSDTKTILAALSRYEKYRTELIQALPKPFAVFPIDYRKEPAWEIDMPYYGSLLNISNTLALHATASLAEKKPTDALDDVRVMFRFSEALDREPLLISQLVNTAIMNINLHSIWEGIYRMAWSPDQLSQIAALLSSQDSLKNMQIGLEGEEILFFTRMVDHVKTRSFFEKMNFFNLLHDFSSSEKNSLSETLFGLGLGLMPNGWFDQNKIKAFYYYKNYIFASIDTKNHRLDVDKISQLEPALNSEKMAVRPTNFLVALTLPAVSGSFQTMGQTQAFLDMARIACQLELYYRSNHLYPPSLSDLKQTLPFDVITGEPYHYSLTPNGRYKLWSAGWNQKDEGGSIAFKDKENTNPDRSRGDWVWAYPEK